MRTSDLQKVCQWAKSSKSPSEVYNAACRILDEAAVRNEELERLRAELAEPRPTFKAFRLVDGQRMAATQRAEKAEAELDALKAAVDDTLWRLHQLRSWAYRETTAEVQHNVLSVITNVWDCLDPDRTRGPALRSPEKRPESHRGAEEATR